MATTTYPHIEIDATGQPRVAGKGYKVRMLAEEHVQWRLSAEQLQLQHPDLTLAEAHAALAYYYDHQTAMDADIAARRANASQILKELGPSEGAEKIRNAKSGS